MISLLLLLLLEFFCNSHAIYYDAYSEKRLSTEEVESLDDLAADWCINNIAPCDPHEGRRVDGSCNNLDHPVYGAKHSRSTMMLPTRLKKDSDKTKAADGKDLPLARYLRTELLLEGKASHQKLTTLATNYLLFIVADSTSAHDSRNYAVNNTKCCEPAHINDYACAPNLIPKDDPVHRYSRYCCFNMTRPLTYQSQGCIAKGSPPERISLATPLIDLSSIYGNSELPDSYRTLKGGTFKYELINGKAWPPSTTSKSNLPACTLNNATETRCHDAPDFFTANSLGPINMLFILFFRQHNRIAMKLSELNPCWSDQKVFDTAKDINIAIALQIYYYEALPVFLGKERMEKDGIISSYCGFRDIYDKKILPQVSQEYLYILRLLHTWQEGTLEMYDAAGTCINKFPVVNMTLRTGLLANGKNLGYFYQGFFRQPCGAADYAVHPDMAERVFGGILDISDVFTSDLSKGRYFGFQPYIKYREYCSGKPVTCWDDLKDVLNDQNIEKLKKNYKNINDVELLAGVWLEKTSYKSDNYISTFYCIMKDQLLRFVKSDRHWYERCDRPNAFSLAQLLEIRKSTIACLLCLFADSVTEIQPQAFLRYGPGNEITKCSNLPKIDFSPWADPKCAYKKPKNKRKPE